MFWSVLCLQLVDGCVFIYRLVYFQCGWYWGPLSWDDAESRLANKPDGSFLVRDSSDDRYILSLSFRSQCTTHHTRIEHYKGKDCFTSMLNTSGLLLLFHFSWFSGDVFSSVWIQSWIQLRTPAPWSHGASNDAVMWFLAARVLKEAVF